MTPKATIISKIESCTLQLHTWKPFDPNSTSKKPCLSNRSTAPNNTNETLDLDKLNLNNNNNNNNDDSASYRRWLHQHRKRRRRGSRSVSGRSSDRSGTHRRASAAYATCSDFPLAAAGGTDSSGELFVNSYGVYGGEGSCWGSDNGSSEVKVSRKEVNMEKENFGEGGNEGQVQGGNSGELVLSGYGSEPGYRGDGELGDPGDDFDEEEEEDGKHMFWGDHIGGGGGGGLKQQKAHRSCRPDPVGVADPEGQIEPDYLSTSKDADPMEIVGDNKFSEQKVHHRCRRKKHDWRFISPLR